MTTGAATVRPPRARGSLLRVLGTGFGIAVLVGNTIGMGILRTPGEVARHLPSVPLFLAVWAGGAIYALIGAMTLAELGAMRPRSGGLYPLVHDELGAAPGFLAGWTDWLITCGSAAAIAMVLAEYAGPLVPPLAGREGWTASAVVAALGLLQWRGIRLGNVVQITTSLVKALALVGLAAVALYMSRGLPDAAAAVPAPVLPGGAVALAVAVIVSFQSVIYTYDGWTGPLYFGEETRDPGRDVPRSMIGGVLLVLGIYLALNVAFLLIIPISEMAGDPFVAATAARRLFGGPGDTVLRVIMIFSMVAAINAIILMYSRIPYAMSSDNLLPPLLRSVNPGGTPVPALLVGTLLALLFIVTNTFETVLALLSFFMVANYLLAFLAFFRARRRAPDAHRPFLAPGYPWLPAMALFGSAAFLVAAVWGDPLHSAIALGLLALSWPVSRYLERHLAR